MFTGGNKQIEVNLKNMYEQPQAREPGPGKEMMEYVKKAWDAGKYHQSESCWSG